MSSRPETDLLPWWMRWKLPPERPMLMIVGRRGSGKTLLATKILQGRMAQGERCYANYPVVLYRKEYHGFLWLHVRYVPICRAGIISSLIQTLDLRNCTICIDEANLWASTREWQKIPSSVLGSWMQSRKGGASFIFTTQHETRVDKVIQQLTDWILVCDRFPLLPKWMPVFRYHRTYLEELVEVRRGTVYRGHAWWCKDSVMMCYETHERVNAEMLDELRAYSKALKAGLDPDEIGVGIPPRIEPERYDSKTQTWIPWEEGETVDSDMGGSNGPVGCLQGTTE